MRIHLKNVPVEFHPQQEEEEQQQDE